jgi:tetratricopeptide (TPR) repeat protein
MQDLVIHTSKTAKPRIIIVVVAIVSLVAAFFAVRWQLGNMLADLTKFDDPNAAEIAAVASDWAPADPVARWLRASTAGDPAEAITLYEQTIQLAPNDYRWRIELARALEQDDQPDRAEAELKRALELAPTYAYPRWHLGNFYLRQDRPDEAIAELKKAGENNQFYRDQVFSLAWDYFNKDPAQLENLAGDEAEARARLAYFFAARGYAPDALRNWNRLTGEEKAKRDYVARVIAQGLFEKRAFPQALEFSRQLGLDVEAAPEAVTNGMFEKGVSQGDGSRFGWALVRNDPNVEMATDTRVKHEGTRSLRTAFKGNVKPGFANIYQTVVVEPGKRYRLRFWVRTENLKSAGMPMLQVVNANDGKLIAGSPPFPGGTADWRELSAEFETPPNCNGITIRTVRGDCGEDCPITGTFWYDDFELSRS